jgi:hypothetical protein
MLPGTNGLPDPTKIQTFLSPASNPVDLEPGPNGDIFYADLEGGAIHRLSYSPGSGGGGSCSAGQFDAQYFNDVTLVGTPAIDRCETSINNDWGLGSPDPSISADNFSARWTGTFNFATTGQYTFTATADDGVRVLVDGNTVIDKFIDQPATTYTGTVTLAAGNHAVEVDYYERGGLASAKVDWAFSGTVGACQTGSFDAQYFNNQTFTGSPALERCEATINNDWGTGSPAAGINADHISVRWIGSFNFATAGDYTFTATADDGVRLYVDGNLLIDKFLDEPATTYTATATLTAGTHTVRVDYYENGGAAVAKASWQSGP